MLRKENMSERLIHTLERKYHPEISYTGFSSEQKQRVKNHIESIGFPTDNIQEVVYRQGKKGEENILGSFQPHDGTFTLFKSLDNLPPIAQHATIVHEFAHSLSPFDPKSEKFYGSNQTLKEAKEHAIAVAEQSKITHKYLNGYQAKLHEQLEAGEIDDLRFVEETRAIMMELRFTNPNHLKQVESAQIKALSGGENVSIIDGVDRTISILIPKLQTKEDIDKHINSLKKKVINQGQPILPNQSFQKAA